MIPWASLSDETGIVLSGIHVDDFLTVISFASRAAKWKQQLSTFWEITDLGEATFCVGIAIECNLVNQHIYLSQMALINEILSQFCMTEANAISTPMDTGITLCRMPATPLPPQEVALKAFPYQILVSLLMYLVICTHPDIALAMQKLSQPWIVSTCHICLQQIASFTT
jgi:hypothetical protein